MDFGRVLDAVIACLDRYDAPYALIGGLGMAAYGMPRTTLDVDFVVPGEVQETLVTYLEGLGYETLHRSNLPSDGLDLERDLKTTEADVEALRRNRPIEPAGSLENLDRLEAPGIGAPRGRRRTVFPDQPPFELRHSRGGNS